MRVAAFLLSCAGLSGCSAGGRSAPALSPELAKAASPAAVPPLQYQMTQPLVYDVTRSDSLRYDNPATGAPVGTLKIGLLVVRPTRNHAAPEFEVVLQSLMAGPSVEAWNCHEPVGVKQPKSKFGQA